MITQRELFFQHLALPSSTPLALEIEKAEGIYLYDSEGKAYIDLVSGVAVSNVGHRHPAILSAIKQQLDQYMHLMVYGKYIQSPQVKLAKRLSDLLPRGLDSTYFVNSGSEAIEGAMKLSKRYTGRTEIIAFKNAYHGGTQGALSALGNEEMKYAYRPLLPDVKFLDFDDSSVLKEITEKTACVLIEPIQAEAGIIIPADAYIHKLRQRCSETGTLLIFDEIQMGFGRTGKLFCFENWDVAPDIICLAKGMGGGMPIGAFISSKEIMSSLTFNPELGHITTFGGHPVCCAAALANIDVLQQENLIDMVNEKGELFYNKLSEHIAIKEIRHKGLMIAVELESPEVCNKLTGIFVKNGLVVDQFLFCPQAFRIAPPLTITKEEINVACEAILRSFDEIVDK